VIFICAPLRPWATHHLKPPAVMHTLNRKWAMFAKNFLLNSAAIARVATSEVDDFGDAAPR
jgi:hypothetical protein